MDAPSASNYAILVGLQLFYTSRKTINKSNVVGSAYLKLVPCPLEKWTGKFESHLVILWLYLSLFLSYPFFCVQYFFPFLEQVRIQLADKVLKKFSLDSSLSLLFHKGKVSRGAVGVIVPTVFEENPIDAEYLHQ